MSSAVNLSRQIAISLNSVVILSRQMSQLNLSRFFEASKNKGFHNDKRSRISRYSKLERTMNTRIYKRGRPGKTFFWQDKMDTVDKNHHILDSLVGVFQKHTRQNSLFVQSSRNSWFIQTLRSKIKMKFTDHEKEKDKLGILVK